MEVLTENLSKNRIGSLDLLKGIVMVVMALDHTRDFFHAYSFHYGVEDPLTTSLPIFLTRWITHYCAPAFSFLAGISAFLMGLKKSKKEVSEFLLKRGLWLILLELTIINFGWSFSTEFNTFYLIVIWSLGVSMVVLSGLVYLPKPILLGFSLLLIFGHNFFDKVQFEGSLLWTAMHHGGQFKFENITFYVGYPVIPWIAVMSLGYYFGSIYKREFKPENRRLILNIVGVSSIVLFFLIRGLNLFGNPRPWVQFENTSQSLISFLNPEKYPPSLLYLLMTLGPAMVFMANSENLKGRIVDFFSTFGRVPFFYYVLHLYLIHTLSLLANQLAMHGFRLWVVYVVWTGIILALYPLCRKFDQYKTRNKEKWWLSYL
jgi:uncharacterized membrane protein